MIFFKAVDECTRVIGRSVQGSKAADMDPKDVEPKAACRSNKQEIGGNSVVGTSSDALQGMSLLLDGYTIRCGYESPISKNRQRVYLEINQSFNKALGGSVYFSGTLDIFPAVLSNDGGNPQVQSWCLHAWHT